MLDTRDRARLRELVEYLVASATAGRARLLVEKPWLRQANRSKEDDVQEVLTALFNDRPPPDARVLRRFGSYPGFVMQKSALGHFVMGVTRNVLQRAYRKYRIGWEELTEDLAMLDLSAHRPPHLAGLPTWLVDLKGAVERLLPEQHELFNLIYGEHLDCPEVCARLGITPDVFHARKSRLLKRLRRLLQGDET